MGSVRTELKRQKTSNKNALPHFKAFAEHRKHLTTLTTERSPQGGTLCVLGAGNCYDLNLEQLLERFEQIHLVDFDKEAVSRARSRLRATLQSRIVVHAPVDLSGANDRLAAWRDMKATPEEFMALPKRAATALHGELEGPFDTVLSACLMSQLLLTLRRVLTDRHPLFQAATVTLTLAHLRTLAILCKPSGRALFATDVTSDEIAPLSKLTRDADAGQFLEELIDSGKVFNALSHETIKALAEDDPTLQRGFRLSEPLDVWTWRNGPARTFLVYAVELEAKRRAAASNPGPPRGPAP